MISARIMRQGPVYISGLVLTALSGGAYIAQSSFVNEESSFLYFMFCYSLVIAFMILRWVSKTRVEPAQKIFHKTWLLTLFLISCYSLNESIGLFAPSVIWFRIVLNVVMVNLLLFAYWSYLSVWVKACISFINGTGVTVFLYLSLYLLPGYPMAGLLLPVLGISFHVFIPLCLLIHSYRLQRRVGALEGRLFYYFLTGFSLSILLCVISAVKWGNTVNRLNDIIEATSEKEEDLNEMLAAARYITPSAKNINVLKNAENRWTRSDSRVNIFSLGLFNDRDVNALQHDPLLQIALVTGGTLHISRSERTALLRLITDSRHESEERLWDDSNLKTLSVDTRIDIWPSCYLSYTDKLIKLGAAPRASRFVPGEAIYTFELPQGAVVTSLSLWVNGKEEKGVLSTREKADSAYRQIVGKEKRDPSIVHWQEGNSVVVRVFPVTAEEPRQFRLGITSPLSIIAGKAVYNSIYFKGPDASGALETISTQLHETVGGLEISKDFVSHADRSYTRRGDCNPVFALGFDATLSRNCSYSFGSSTYKMFPYHEELESIQLANLYLDVNSAWSKKEFMELAAFSDRLNVFVWDMSMVRVTKENAESYWQKLKQQHLSLFPFYKVETASQSLVVTKNEKGYLALTALKETDFYKNTRLYFKQSAQVRVFGLGGSLLPYQRSLIEYRRLQYEEGNIAILKNRIIKNNYPRSIENENLVVIPQSGLAIYRLSGIGDSGGPDHLMRLFAYNAVMRLYGENMRAAKTESDAIMQLARAANIVTPISSLVVLESQQDYERFDLKSDPEGLGNAALANQGAVPEPHEWLLLIAGAMLVFYYGIWHKRKTRIV